MSGPRPLGGRFKSVGLLEWKVFNPISVRPRDLRPTWQSSLSYQAVHNVVFYDTTPTRMVLS